jgi:hypothetical protein
MTKQATVRVAIDVGPLQIRRGEEFWLAWQAMAIAR